MQGLCLEIDIGLYVRYWSLLWWTGGGEEGWLMWGWSGGLVGDMCSLSPPMQISIIMSCKINTDLNLFALNKINKETKISL